MDRHLALRALRAWSAMEQSDAATAAGLTVKTVSLAERGQCCTEKTWSKLRAVYAARGVILEEGPPERIVRM